ncbi:MAG: hypothetical protein JO360_09610 [Acidobacteria bacterium]|nr:hypothetical protein [Acidobacteriota bacterium]
MADDNDNTCDHPACSCPTTDDQDYCSAYCENAEDTAEIACDCGHPNCS